ncbi:hypothetical protein [Maribacter aestuarii]|uniref:hypothetical protein n=1 Tax=Maribacter aestuarii TaxID=1130723 RepID=UPI00248C1441|nr:hypothetical protein [Maribacter aestuarii]
MTLLNGYWEISEVEFPDGNTKEYKINSNVDYFQLEGLKGFRKKVNPKFDGSFETSDDAEPFTILEENEVFTIRYKNNLSSWQEIIVSLSNENFSLKNEEGTIYHYKRFEPINVSD